MLIELLRDSHAEKAGAQQRKRQGPSVTPPSLAGHRAVSATRTSSFLCAFFFRRDSQSQYHRSQGKKDRASFTSTALGGKDTSEH